MTSMHVLVAAMRGTPMQRLASRVATGVGRVPRPVASAPRTGTDDRPRGVIARMLRWLVVLPIVLSACAPGRHSAGAERSRARWRSRSWPVPCARSSEIHPTLRASRGRWQGARSSVSARRRARHPRGRGRRATMPGGPPISLPAGDYIVIGSDVDGRDGAAGASRSISVVRGSRPMSRLAHLRHRHPLRARRAHRTGISSSFSAGSTLSPNVAMNSAWLRPTLWR